MPAPRLCAIRAPQIRPLKCVRGRGRLSAHLCCPYRVACSPFQTACSPGLVTPQTLDRQRHIGRFGSPDSGHCHAHSCRRFSLVLQLARLGVSLSSLSFPRVICSSLAINDMYSYWSMEQPWTDSDNGPRHLRPEARCAGARPWATAPSRDCLHAASGSEVGQPLCGMCVQLNLCSTETSSCRSGHWR